jgi:hypothetical protein
MSIEDEIEERKHRVEVIKLALDGFFNVRERRVPVGLKEKKENRRKNIQGNIAELHHGQKLF